ncbi:MAG: glucose-1-phosphate adenylyltransferase [Anaerolineaceae bacterium]|nr:glucose-1-phosphate adenylyltransferase [Anaerolineaceae bacterium]
MKIRAVILAGGEGSRLKVLTSKRAKPAVFFAGKYRIIDFSLSNCVNSNINDVMVLAQYRPQSLIEHIGSGAPWDLNRDISGGVRILTPYKSLASDWFVGTADAVQQNFTFIKRGNPDHILVLSGDHIYKMDYQKMVNFHQSNNADLTIATITVPIEEASRYGIMHYDENFQVIEFLEKPENPPTNTINMGIYLFKQEVLNQELWNDHFRIGSFHDFGKDIIPSMIKNNSRVFAYPYDGYWVDVGTLESYWQAHMDLLAEYPSFQLYNPYWIIHTRTEERPPALIKKGAIVENSMISDGCVIESDAVVRNSVFSPGVYVMNGAQINHSIIFTDCFIDRNSTIDCSVLDKRVKVGENCKIGDHNLDYQITLIGRDSIILPESIIQANAIIGPDVIPSDYNSTLIKSGEYVQTRRLPYEI